MDLIYDFFRRYFQYSFYYHKRQKGIRYYSDGDKIILERISNQTDTATSP